MAGEPSFFAEIDGKWHEMPSDEVTRCGLDIPFGTPWTRTKPAKVHCGADAVNNPEPMQEVVDTLPEQPVPTEEIVADVPGDDEKNIATKEAKTADAPARPAATKAAPATAKAKK